MEPGREGWGEGTQREWGMTHSPTACAGTSQCQVTFWCLEKASRLHLDLAKLSRILKGLMIIITDWVIIIG